MKQIRFLLLTMLLVQTGALLSAAGSSQMVTSPVLPGATPDTALQAEKEPAVEPVVEAPVEPVAMAPGAEVSTGFIDEETALPEVAPVVTPVVTQEPVQPVAEKKETAPSIKKESVAVSARIGSVEVEKVITSADEFRDKATVVQKELRERAERLKKEYEDLEKQRVENKVSPADLAKKRNNLEIDERDLQMEAEGRQRQLQEEMFVAFQEAVEKVAKKQNFDMVAPKFFYVAEKCNISDIVLKKMNDLYAQKKAKAKFAKPQAGNGVSGVNGGNGGAKVAPKTNGAKAPAPKTASNGAKAKPAVKAVKKS